MAQTSDPQEQGDQLFRDVATHTTVPVSCCDRYFRYVWVSDALAEMLGSTKSKMEGRLIPDVIGRPAFERLEPYMRHALEGRTVSFHARVPYSRVGWRCIDATYAPTFDPEGKATGWVATITDTTRQSELEKSLESLKTESEATLATLQHELRNPLAAITYGLEALLRITAAETSKVQKLTDVMQRQLQLMDRIVGDLTCDLLQPTILEVIKRIPLQTILQTALDATQHLFDLLKHDLRVSVPTAPVLIDADADHLSQALVNLLRNSAQYTPSGGMVEVACEVTASIVTVSVKDSGIGIPQHELSKVFDLYMRGERSQQLQPHGLGIGLKVVKQVVDAHNGAVEVRSEGPGRGTEFIIRLPLAAKAL